MKKKIACIFLLLFIIILLLWLVFANDHEDSTHFVIPDSSSVTFEELISFPYVTDGVWSFISLKTRLNGKFVYSSNINQDSECIQLLDELKEILDQVPLYTYVPEEKVRNYDKHVKDLLWEKEGKPLYIQIAAGTLAPLKINPGDISPTHVRIYSLDGSRCYLTIGYRKETEIDSTHYVFYTDDPVIVEALFGFAESLKTVNIE